MCHFRIKLLIISMNLKKAQESGGVRKKLQNYSYLLSQNIGKGYSSVVFRGRNDLTDQTVAIKVIDMKKICNQIHRNLLSSEIEVLKLMKNNQNVIELYDIYTTKNNTYIITELCEGGDLAKLISARKNMPQAEAIPIMNQIINGYNQMFGQTIVHRDLKPANIFMKNGSPKIADFGFAMKMNESKKYSSYNVGSPVYMPPEALNSNKYSFKSDIWALGVIYYEMLTGKTPWRAKTQKQLAKLLVSIPIKKVLPPTISQSSETFLLRTLAVDINDRMNPEEMLRFNLSCDRCSLPKNIFSTEYSIFDGRNNNIRHQAQVDRHDTSLNKKSVNQPVNFKRLALLESTQQFNTTKCTLPKTAVTASTKTQNFMLGSTKTIGNDQPTQKLIKTHHLINDSAAYDKKYLAKQLLSQIHFCRFLFKLIIRMNDKLTAAANDDLTVIKQYMAGLIFHKLSEVEELKLIDPKIQLDFQASSDFNKIQQIILQYQSKYSRDLSSLRQVSTPLLTFKDQLNINILNLYKQIEGIDIGESKEQIIVLDYMVTLRQLIGIMQNNDLEGFHIKSKIETIVEGAPAKNITEQHLSAIKSKLKSIKII